jgi:phosphoribosylformylglycinamidine synthase PurS subunit
MDFMPRVRVYGGVGSIIYAGAVKARVLIRPKEGILDPQGKAVERALPALGFDDVSHVRVGRLVELEAKSDDRLAELCEKLLANPLIEDYEIQVVDGSDRK